MWWRVDMPRDRALGGECKRAIAVVLERRVVVAREQFAQVPQHRDRAFERNRHRRGHPFGRADFETAERPFGAAQFVEPRFEHRTRDGVGLLHRAIRRGLGIEQGQDFSVDAPVCRDGGEDGVGCDGRCSDLRCANDGKRAGECRATRKLPRFAYARPPQPLFGEIITIFGDTLTISCLKFHVKEFGDNFTE